MSEYQKMLEEVEGFRSKLAPFLTSKLEEFRLLGLNHISADELWEFTKEKIAKELKKQHLDDLHLYQLVSILMSLSVNDYMNKIRLEMFKSEDLDQFAF